MVKVQAFDRDNDAHMALIKNFICEFAVAYPLYRAYFKRFAYLFYINSHFNVSFLLHYNYSSSVSAGTTL